MENRITHATCREQVDLTNRNAVAELVSSLRKGSVRKETGLFFVEGVKMVGEALLSGGTVEAIIVCPEMCPSADVLPMLPAGITDRVVEIHRRKYENAARHFAPKQSPQGIGALVKQSWTAIDRFFPEPDAIIVALCSVQDGGNVGTILRTSDAVGCSAVFVLGETADPYGPASVKASLGSIFGRRIIRSDIRHLQRWASYTGVTLVGTSPRAETSYKRAPYRRPMVLMLGNEATGLTDMEIDSCHQVVSIPMNGRRDSLNVAVAGAVIMYEALHHTASQGGKCTRK